MNNQEARGLEKPGHSWASCSEIHGTVFNMNMIKLAPIQNCAETNKQKMWQHRPRGTSFRHGKYKLKVVVGFCSMDSERNEDRQCMAGLESRKVPFRRHQMELKPKAPWRPEGSRGTRTMGVH